VTVYNVYYRTNTQGAFHRVGEYESNDDVMTWEEIALQVVKNPAVGGRILVVSPSEAVILKYKARLEFA
jgi:hypothetical protein